MLLLVTGERYGQAIASDTQLVAYRLTPVPGYSTTRVISNRAWNVRHRFNVPKHIEAQENTAYQPRKKDGGIDRRYNIRDNSRRASDDYPAAPKLLLTIILVVPALAVLLLHPYPIWELRDPWRWDDIGLLPLMWFLTLIFLWGNCRLARTIGYVKEVGSWKRKAFVGYLFRSAPFGWWYIIGIPFMALLVFWLSYYLEVGVIWLMRIALLALLGLAIIIGLQMRSTAKAISRLIPCEERCEHY